MKLGALKTPASGVAEKCSWLMLSSRRLNKVMAMLTGWMKGALRRVQGRGGRVGGKQTCGKCISGQGKVGHKGVRELQRHSSPQQRRGLPVLSRPGCWAAHTGKRDSATTPRGPVYKPGPAITHPSTKSQTSTGQLKLPRLAGTT